MATVTHDGQSFSIDGRRIWVIGAGIDYARVHPDSWADRIASARQSGFNTVVTTCPWLLHEPRKGRFVFTGGADIRRFVEICHAAGLWVMLRPGPFVGSGYDAGGLPSWLLDLPGVRLREANPLFLERVSVYIRKLVNEIDDLQVTNGGPILLFQSEHAWRCANEDQAAKYLGEVTRYLRENGVGVPIVNTNDLWQEAIGTIDTWRGEDDLLSHLRQLRAVQPDAPRLVSAIEAAPPGVWGAPSPEERSPASIVQLVAQVLAAGAQPIVAPFHGGTNFGFLGGRLSGGPDRFVTTEAAPSAPLDESGNRTPAAIALGRLLSFARDFAHVFADLEHDYHPIGLDVTELAATGTRSGAGKTPRRVSVVPLRGRAGTVVFVFADGAQQRATLLLEQGIRMPVDLGDQPVGWFVFDTDLLGAGRLDYANLCPLAMIGRTVLVLQGPAGAPVYLSVDGSPIQATVPSGTRPLVIQHMRLTLVICNQQHADRVLHDGNRVYFGVDRLDSEGQPLVARRSGTLLAIESGGELEKVDPAGVVRTGLKAARELSAWEINSAEPYSRGTSPRFASLDGPQSLSDCGAGFGYGWYRIQLKVTSTRTLKLHLPEAADRVHLFVDGEIQHIAGVGSGAERGPFELQLEKGTPTLVALVDNLGRFAEGNDLGQPKGLYGHLRTVKKLTGVKPTRTTAEAVDPFRLRGYIAGRTFGQRSSVEQVSWTFTHARSTPILLEIDGAQASGTIVLNDEPLAYYAGATGACLGRYLLSKATAERFKRGKNVLRFAPDPRQEGAVDDVIKATTIYECVGTPSEGATWAFGKWTPPPDAGYETISRNAARNARGTPCWWRAFFNVGENATQLRIDTAGLSKGFVRINGNDVGRYFTATRDGKTVGPQQTLYVPGPWLEKGDENEITIFDEHGFSPFKVKLRGG